MKEFAVCFIILKIKFRTNAIIICCLPPRPRRRDDDARPCVAKHATDDATTTTTMAQPLPNDSSPAAGRDNQFTQLSTLTTIVALPMSLSTDKKKR